MCVCLFVLRATPIGPRRIGARVACLAVRVRGFGAVELRRLSNQPPRGADLSPP